MGSVKQAESSSDEDLLAELGYKQELRRGLSGFTNFATSFSIISILAGCITTYYLAMDAGGPMAINTGWLVVSLLVLCVALAMGEICSAYPTAGGLYWWASRLARTNKRHWAWGGRLVQLPRRGRGHRVDRLRRRPHLGGRLLDGHR